MEEAMLDENEAAPGEIGAVVATVEPVADELLRGLEARLCAAEERLAELCASAAIHAQAAAQNAQATVRVAEAAVRKTVSAAGQTLLAKHGAGDQGAGGLAAVDAALRSLPVEQRLAVKSELLRAGLL